MKQKQHPYPCNCIHCIAQRKRELKTDPAWQAYLKEHRERLRMECAREMEINQIPLADLNDDDQERDLPEGEGYSPWLESLIGDEV